MKDHPGKCKVFARGERALYGNGLNMPDFSLRWPRYQSVSWQNVDILVGQAKSNF